MAQPANTFATNDQIGRREDLSESIWMVSPSDTPGYSQMSKTKATGTEHEWQTDSLRASGNNAKVEGSDVQAAAAQPTVRRKNITQLSDDSVRVSSRAQKVRTAGRSNELTYQKEVKKGVELRNDIETVLFLNKPKVEGDDSTAPELAGIPAWIKTNTDFGTGGTDPTVADGSDARNDGTQRLLRENQVKLVLQEAWNAGGKPDCFFVGGFNRQLFSSFMEGRTPMQKVTDKTMHATYDRYDSDFGQVKVVPDRFMRARDGLLLQMNMWKVAVLQDFHSFDLAKTGHSDGWVIAYEYTLESCNEEASAGVFDLKTS